MFDLDAPQTRRTALGYRLFRSIENPSEVFIQVEFDSTEEAASARQRLLTSGVLDRFRDKTGPTLIEEAERHDSKRTLPHRTPTETATPKERI
jgi:hypothetical protein